MTVRDIIVCILAFMPTGWGMLLVSNCFGHPFSLMCYYKAGQIVTKPPLKLVALFLLYKSYLLSC